MTTQPDQEIINAARKVLREALDAVAVHPCDEHNDLVIASSLYGPMEELYRAMLGQPDQDPTLQEKLRADAASGECARSTNLALIAAADRIDELEKKCKQLDESESQLIQERDHWLEKATELANDVGGYFRVNVGEHTSANCPVEQAIAIVGGEYVTDSDDDRKIAELERQLAEAQKDQARLDVIANEYLQIEAFEIPTGADDADVGWRIYQSYTEEVKPRLIVEQFEDDFRRAIDAAIQKVKS